MKWIWQPRFVGRTKTASTPLSGQSTARKGHNSKRRFASRSRCSPGQASAYFKFDAGKLGDLKVHEIDLSEEAGDIAKSVFGKGQKGYFAFGKDALYVSYGPDGMKLLKEAVEAKAGPAPVFDSTSNPKKASVLIKKILPANGQNGRGGFGVGGVEAMSMSGMQVTLEGGDRLKLKVRLNLGSAITMGLGWFVSEAKPAAAPQPWPPRPRSRLASKCGLQLRLNATRPLQSRAGIRSFGWHTFPTVCSYADWKPKPRKARMGGLYRKCLFNRYFGVGD